MRLFTTFITAVCVLFLKMVKIGTFCFSLFVFVYLGDLKFAKAIDSPCNGRRREQGMLLVDPRITLLVEHCAK